jgi:site-specific DNA-methyltransferase (adenine-specific)
MPEKNKTTVSASQDFQQSAPEFNRILTGDCLEILPQVAADSIHFVVTSPPYNVGIEYDKHEDQLEYSAYRDWLKKVWTEVKRVLVPGGRFALNVAPTSIKNFRPIHYDLAHDFVELGFIMRTEILWYKQTIYRRTAWGSWKSPSNPHIMPSWEYLLIFSKDSWKLEGDREKADITGDEFIAFSNGFWYIPPEGKRRGHPAPFPEELIYRLIKFYTYQDNVVLDMFGGTGTVALTAAKTKRQYLHIDISEEYNEIARRRLADYEAEQNQLALVDTQKHHADEQLKRTERRQEIIDATKKTYSSSD